MPGYIKDTMSRKSNFIGIKLYKREYIFTIDRLKFVKAFDGEKSTYRLCRTYQGPHSLAYCDIFDGEEIKRPNYEIEDIKDFCEVFDEAELLEKRYVLTHEEVNEKLRSLNEGSLIL